MYKAVHNSDDSQQTDRVEFSEVVLVRETLEDAIGQCRNWLEDATDLSPETNIVPVNSTLSGKASARNAQLDFGYFACSRRSRDARGDFIPGASLRVASAK